jgi:hypothetical protein
MLSQRTRLGGVLSYSVNRNTELAQLVIKEILKMPDGAHSAAAEETQNFIATDLCVFARPKVRFFKIHSDAKLDEDHDLVDL